jgi:hypothetical protein
VAPLCCLLELEAACAGFNRAPCSGQYLHQLIKTCISWLIYSYLLEFKLLSSHHLSYCHLLSCPILQCPVLYSCLACMSGRVCPAPSCLPCSAMPCHVCSSSALRLPCPVLSCSSSVLFCFALLCSVLACPARLHCFTPPYPAVRCSVFSSSALPFRVLPYLTLPCPVLFVLLCIAVLRPALHCLLVVSSNEHLTQSRR